MIDWNEDDIVLIENFLDGKLSPDERTRLELRLREDAVFERQVREFAELKKGIENVGRRELLSELQSWEKKEEPVKSRQVFLSNTKIAIGIAALLLVGLSSYFLWPAQSHDELFQRYFEPYPNIIMPQVRGADSSDSTMIAKAFAAYDRGQWEAALDYFNKADTTLHLRLYTGICYLALNQSNNAISSFEEAIENDSIFNEQAQWYLGLAYLKSGNSRRAKELFEVIARGGSSYKFKSTDILNHIKS